MDVAELTAHLKAEVASFQMNMKAADAQLEATRRSMREVERSAATLSAALGTVKVSAAQAAETKGALETMGRSISGVTRNAIEAADRLDKVKIGATQAAESRLNADIIAGSLDKITRKSIEARVASGGGGGGGANPYGLNFLASGAIRTGLAVGGLALGPALAPALVGLSTALPAMLGALAGGAGVLLGAFHGLNAAALTTQKGFDALSPEQKKLATTLRRLDAGLIDSLGGITQRTILPAANQALQSALTPASVGALTQATQAFSNAIAGALKSWGQLLGSTGFAQAFGQVLVADAGYLHDFLIGLKNIFEGLVHLQQAGTPFLDWVSKVSQHFTVWFDQTIKTAQANGSLARTFDEAKQALQAIGGLLASAWHLLVSFTEAFGGFATSMTLIRDLGALLGLVTTLLDEARKPLTDLVQAVLWFTGTFISKLQELVPYFKPVFDNLDRVLRSLKFIQPVVEAILTVMTKMAEVELWALGKMLGGLAFFLENARQIVSGLGRLFVNLGQDMVAAMAWAAKEMTKQLLYPITTLLAAAAHLPFGMGTPFKSALNDINTWLSSTWGPGFVGVMSGVGFQAGQAAGFMIGKAMQTAVDSATGIAAAAGIPINRRGPGSSQVFSKGGYPLSQQGSLVGTPGQGTHSYTEGSGPGGFLWQDDQAVDITMQPGTKVLAAADGDLSGARYGGDAGRYSGWGVTLNATNGDMYFYKHIKFLWVRQGFVRQGQAIGIGTTTGHLHFARKGATTAAQVLATGTPVIAPSGQSPFGTPPPLTPLPGTTTRPSLLDQVFSLTRQSRLTAAETAFAAGTGAGTSPHQQEQASLALLKEAHREQAFLTAELAKQVEGSKKYLEIEKELKHVQQDINRAKAEEGRADKALQSAAANRAVMRIFGLDPSGGELAPGTGAITRQFDALRKLAREHPIVDTPAVEAELKRLSRALRIHGITPADLAFLRERLRALGQTLRAGIKQAAQDAKDALQQLRDIATTHLQDSISKLVSAVQTIQAGVDRAFDQQTQATVGSMNDALNAQVSGMQDAMQKHMQNMQIMVHSAAGDFLFGGAITDTPAERALRSLQEAHDAAERNLSLTQATQQMIAANLTGDPAQIAAARRALYEANYAIQVAGLQKDADTQRTAADQQLKDAQDAYQKQEQARIDAYTREQQDAIQNYQDMRDLQRTAMDEQTQALIDAMAADPANAQIYLGQLQQVWKDNGVPMQNVAFALGGKIYTGLTNALDPLKSYLNDLLATIYAVLSLGGTIPGVPKPPTTPVTHGGSCFPAGTLVLTAHGGERPIAEFAIGDEVLVWDFAAEQLVASEVTDVLIHDDARVLATVSTDLGQIRSTPEHRFWTGRAWVAVDDLRVDDTLMTDTGELATVHLVYTQPAGEAVYNLHVAHEDHNYFANGFLVHNVKENMMFAPGAAGGTQKIEVHTHTYLNGREIAHDVRDELIRLGVSNISIFGGLA